MPTSTTGFAAGVSALVAEVDCGTTSCPDASREGAAVGVEPVANTAPLSAIFRFAAATFSAAFFFSCAAFF
jgi:hypothetical protein